MFDLDLTDLRAFARIADLKSVSAAARALNMPKSSVSRSLARLEAVVGTALVERSNRHLRLTEAGALLYPHALRIMNDVDEAETALGGFVGVPRGTLRVSAPLAYAHTFIAPMLPAFLASYPELRVVLDLNHRNVDMVAQEIDVVVRMGPLVDSGLVARRLPPLEIWLCASPSYLEARGTPTSVADLAAHDFIDRIDGTTEWTFDTPGRGKEHVSIYPRVVSPEPTVGLVMLMGGAGIGRLPRFMAEKAIAAGELVRVLPATRPGTTEVNALYPSHRSLSAKVRVFIDALAAHLGGKKPRG
ncbi:LysR family transcriptional regulator [Archangium minus]|uniref:LysR family transcriptional regulator n=1 Tax=Archangium minus TaxID=83450 RepID=A0ABY9WQD9_9BACT|nr:LysR family transcriptional regulator [Archangium minus]